MLSSSRIPSSALRGVSLLTIVALLLLLSSVLLAQERPDFEGWHAQAPGMNQAIGIQRNEGRPMLVYFYADWCGFCRQFETELLTDDGVNDALKDLIVVRINPENGPAERRLANMYGVNGYPALFVHSGASKTLSRIDRMKLDQGKPRMMTPDEFVDTFRTAAAR
ncbi:MAG: thioredoxin family protein [Acidobacteriota bacterium]